MNIPPELDLAIECTRIHPDPSDVERLRALVHKSVDWGAFLKFAIPHGVLPLAARNLRLFADDLIPEATLVQIESVLVRARVRYMRQCLALDSVIRTLQQSGLRALAYKGPALIAAAYPDPGLREFHDLDIWTAPADMAAAGEVLRRLGYKPSSYQQGRPTPSADHGAKQNEFMSPDGEVVVDLLNLELQPQYYFRPDFDEVWERHQVVKLTEGISLATLFIDDLLAVLAVHGSKHYWRRLNWSADLAALLMRAPDTNWKLLLDRCSRWRCTRRLLGALALQQNLYGSKPAPEMAEALARCPAAAVAARQAAHRLFQTPLQGTLRNAASVFSYHYYSTDRVGDRARLAAAELRRRFSRVSAGGEHTLKARAGACLSSTDSSGRHPGPSSQR